jgi:hypothetical protein
MTTRYVEIIIPSNGAAACHAAMALRQAGYVVGAIQMIYDCSEAALNPKPGSAYIKGGHYCLRQVLHVIH